MSLVPDYNSDSDSGPCSPEKPAVHERSQNDGPKNKSKRKIITLELPTEDVPEIPGAGGAAEEDEEKPVKIEGRVSIASFLPPPKNRKKPASKQQHDMTPRVLGSTNSVPRINISKNIPRRQQQESGAEEPVAGKKTEDNGIPSLFSFDTHKPAIPSAEGARPVRSSSQAAAKQFGPRRPPGAAGADLLEEPAQVQRPPVGSSAGHGAAEGGEGRKKGRKRGREEIPEDGALVEFNVDEFYAQNMEQGNMAQDIKRPVKAVGSSRQQHQLSSLIRSAQQNEAGLQEMYAQQKRTKKEVGSKYGF